MSHRYDITAYYIVPRWNALKAPVAASAQPKAYLVAHSELLSLPVSDRQTVVSVPVSHVASGREKAKERFIIIVPTCNYIQRSDRKVAEDKNKYEGYKYKHEDKYKY